MTSPVPFRWDGEAMVPLAGFGRRCDQLFVVGEVYRLIEEHERSSASHRHYFAAINEAWQNLPDKLAERFPTAEHLRKFALIKTGYHDSRQFVASSKAEALRLAAFLRPVDEYSLVTVAGAVVTVWTAQSQSTKAMGKKTFQESKDHVLDFVAVLIGTDAESLRRAAA